MMQLNMTPPSIIGPTNESPHLADEEGDALGVPLPDGGEDNADAVLVLGL